MKKGYLFCFISLVLLLMAFAGRATASDCTMVVDMNSLQVSGPLDIFGVTSRSFSFVGQVQVGSEIVLSLTSLNALPSPPVCPKPSDEASVSFRNSSGGLQVPSVLFGGSLFSTYVTADLSTDIGIVALPFTNVIAPLTMSDAQRGASSSAWNIFAATNYNLLAGLAYDSFLFKNTLPISCNFGGSGTATYDQATNTSVVNFANCGITSWATCSGEFGVFSFPLAGRSSVMVTSPSVECISIFPGLLTTDITFVDSSTIVAGNVFNLSSSFSGTLNFPTFTVPLNSNVQNLSITSVASGSDLLLFNIGGQAFEQCLGKWYAYDPVSNLLIRDDGITTGHINVVMPEITDTVLTVINNDGTVEVDTNLSGLPGITRYPDIVAFSANCAM